MLSGYVLFYLRYIVRYTIFKGRVHMSLDEDKKGSPTVPFLILYCYNI